MCNYIFEQFEKNDYGYFTNQLASSQIHTVKTFKRYKNFNWVQVAKVLLDELVKIHPYFSKDEKRLILNILTTAIDKPDMAMYIPKFREYGIDDFRLFLCFLDKLEDAQLVKRLAKCEDEKGLIKPFVIYPTVSPKRLFDILEAQKSQILKMKNKLMERGL
jgi:hypothetical protein